MKAYQLNTDDAPPPKPEARKGKGRLKGQELHRIVNGIVSDATAFVDGELSTFRADASSYYAGDPFGNEEEGRSQVVITEVRNTVLGVKPSLMRMFTAPDPVVEFVPRTEQKVQLAKQATDYVNYLFVEKNDGFLNTNSVLDDGLIRRLGCFKWWWEDSRRESHATSGLNQDALFSLVSRDDVTPTSLESHPAEEDGDEETFDVEYTVALPGRIRIAAVPPEEVVYDRGARSIEDALIFGHRRAYPKGDLIAMGVPESAFEDHGGVSGTLEYNAEKTQRRNAVGENIGSTPDAGDANNLHEYGEYYIRLDVDGDGFAELRKICTLGPAFYPVHNEPAPERPFAPFCPIPEAHTLSGLSYADLTMDLQLIKSNLSRGMLDSFALSIFPRTAFVEGQASVEDILNTEIGAPIRMKRDNAVMPFTHPFTGEKALSILSYFDEEGEGRTGQTKGAMSMDSDALQSSTKQAVNAAVTSAQERTEMVARVFAEQCYKRMFRGVYRLLVLHQPKAEIVKLRGQYVNVDVSAWDADMDVIVTVALGTSLPEQRIERLTLIAAKQEQIMQLAGPDNPLVSLAQLRNTYARILELSGERDISSYFKPVDPNYAPPAPPAPPPSPEQILAEAQLQIEKMKIEKELEIKAAELALKKSDQDHEHRMALLNHEFEITKLSHELTLKRYEIDAKNDTLHTQQQEELEAKAEAHALRLMTEDHERQREDAADERAREDAETERQHQLEVLTREQQHEVMTQQPDANMAASEPATDVPAAE